MSNKRKIYNDDDDDGIENVFANKTQIFTSKPNPLSQVPKAPCDVDSLKGTPYKVHPPLPPKSFAMYIVGRPGSGKTNLWLSMLLSGKDNATKKEKEPIYYHGYFDKIFLFSGSIQTLPKCVVRSKKKRCKRTGAVYEQGIPRKQQFDCIDAGHIVNLVEHLRENENHHNLFVFDDLITDLTNQPTLTKLFFNRRHATHNEDKEGHGGLSLMVTSQKFNCLPLKFRQALSHCCIFGTENEQEKRTIRDEFMQDLTKEQQDQVFREVWPDLWDPKAKEQHGFLFIDIYANKFKKYYNKFDLIQFH